MDILISGRLGDLYADVHTKLLRNRGDGTFDDSGVQIARTRLGYSDWGDFNNDGLPDLVMGGEATNRLDTLKLYRNDGNGIFTELVGLPQFAPDRVLWGDFDNDGRRDLVVHGQKYYSSRVPQSSYSAVLRNSGDGIFAPTQLELPEIWSSVGGWADVDDDSRVDFSMAGNSRFGWLLRLYHNNTSKSNSLPIGPEQTFSVVSSNTVTLSWTAGLDAETASNGLTYNVRIGRSPGSGDVIGGLARPDGPESLRLVMRAIGGNTK